MSERGYLLFLLEEYSGKKVSLCKNDQIILFQVLFKTNAEFIAYIGIKIGNDLVSVFLIQFDCILLYSAGLQKN